ncbi:NAD-dependent epimerase/dehydratase family protein [Geomonas oryzae]|uniref:NAD-dependent epimerase/dehydratase family protein n=1 Tax=Geomonas oryzae TaxID=2364273 RepID=UPI00100AD3A8|nr:NAD-dependent epimerase/dehydratase family protein [Geomonas oryzae]
MTPFPSTKRIAILGATSHIAKGLIHQFCLAQDAELYLFARNAQRLRSFLVSIGATQQVRVLPFDEFPIHRYDTVINCVGIGSPGKLVQEPYAVFDITERFDDLVLRYLEREPETLFVSLSSGAAYGTDFSKPPTESSEARFNANALQPTEYYGVAKLCSEAKHRARKELNIVDLRVFGYFSRFIDLDEKFLLSELVSCIKHGREFVTGAHDLVRDFVHPEDLTELVRCLMRQKRINDVLDVYSAGPVGKFEIIAAFTASGALAYRVAEQHAAVTATGVKSNYFSENRRAAAFGYRPRFTSLDCILRETEAILSGTRGAS